MLLGRKGKVDSRVLMDRLAAGEKPRTIAAEFGCSYQTLRNRITRHVHDLGCRTVEQAVAEHVACKIKRALPIALETVVDQVMRKK